MGPDLGFAPNVTTLADDKGGYQRPELALLQALGKPSVGPSHQHVTRRETPKARAAHRAHDQQWPTWWMPIVVAPKRAGDVGVLVIKNTWVLTV